jgi:glycosyltransferase involved in cell wall biosynthesis
MKISVVLCTDNAREPYLRRMLAGLRAQHLPREQWEFLVVDNRSDEPLQDRLNLSWHPAARIVREEKLGLTPARLRGIAEAKKATCWFSSMMTTCSIPITSRSPAASLRKGHS